VRPAAAAVAQARQRPAGRQQEAPAGPEAQQEEQAVQAAPRRPEELVVRAARQAAAVPTWAWQERTAAWHGRWPAGRGR
jgi:hypothetical protein